MPERTPRPRRRPAAADASGKEFVQGLQRGFAVIKAFGHDAASLTIADVAERTGLTRAVARRYLLTLEQLGYVDRSGARFGLTPRLLELGFSYLSSLTVAEVAQPFMEEVTERLHESCSIAVLDGHDIVYVGRVVAKRIMSVNLVVGSRLPAHATSLGKVLLAYLPPERLDRYFATSDRRRITDRTIIAEAALRREFRDIRQRGYAFGDGEVEDGVRALAVPIFNRAHQAEAAINVSAHAWRVSLKDMRQRDLAVLVDVARRVSRALGARVDTLTWATPAAGRRVANL